MTNEADDRDDEDAEASGPGVDPGEKRARVVKEASIRILDDGSLSYKRGEAFSLLLADGVDQGEAWKGAGGVNKGSSGETLRILVANPVFKERLKVLEEERTRLEAAGPHGEAMWAAKQSFRAARLAQDVAATQRAAELIAKVAEKLDPSGEKIANPSGSTEGVRPVGRPPSEARATKQDPAALRRRLAEMGRTAPPAPAEEEAA